MLTGLLFAVACLAYAIGGGIAATRGAGRPTAFRVGMLLLTLCGCALLFALTCRIWLGNAWAYEILALLAGAACAGLGLMFLVFRWLYRRAELRRMAAMDLP